MANIYGNGTTTATAGANTIVHYYDRAGVNAANRVNVYQQWADRKSMPQKYGKTFKISRWEHMYDRTFADGDFATKGYMTARDIAAVNTSLSNATLAEGDGATNQRSLTKVTYETSFARYGEMIDYTDEVDIWSEDYIQVRYREELGELANSRMEDLVQRDMLATTTVLYSGAAGAIGEVGTGAAADGSDDAAWAVDYDLMRKAVRKLVRNRAKKNTMIVTGSNKIGTMPIAKAYYGVIGADVKSDLETLTRGSTYETEYVYVPAHKYAGASSLAEGEVGAMHEIRFIEAESAVVYRGQGGFASAWYNDNDTGLTFPYATEAEAQTAAGSTGFTPAATATLTTYVGSLQNTASGAEGATKFDVFPILFPTEGSFATVGLKGLEKIKFNSRDPKFVTNENPYGTNGFFSYNFFYAGIILKEEALLKVLVAARN
jgi:N4-gp56 family major capsid protein